MSKRALLMIAIACLMALVLVPPAQAAFNITDFEVTYEDAQGQPTAQAGQHPFAMTTSVDFSTKPGPKPGEVLADGSTKDLTVELPAGLIGDRAAVPYCSTADFLVVEAGASTCPNVSAIGFLNVRTPGVPVGTVSNRSGAFNLVPPPGAAAKLGFIILGVPTALLIRVSPDYPHNLIASVQNAADIEPLGGTDLTIWGNPVSRVHDDDRGLCAGIQENCSIDFEEKPFLTLPRACTGPLFTTYEATSWEEPDGLLPGSSGSPLETINCGSLPFGPTIAAKPTTLAAQSPTGLDFSLDVKDEGLQNPDGLANSDVRKAVVTLPEGFSVNPSIAEGLEVCTQAQLARESAFSAPGDGCPNASKIGSVEVETPLLNENVNGALYQAVPYENPFNSLIALYVVIKNPVLGIVVRQALKVEPDPVTGRLTTVADDIPQLPFSHFKLHFREGTRSPLASPPGCGTYNAQAVLYPWSGNPPVTTNSAFQIITGPESGPCPTGGLPPFRPGLIAGTLNNAAGRYSPFNVRLFRSDSEQEITHFSIKLPPGIVGKLAGIPFCSDAAIAAAKARTGPHGGLEELNGPSCPAASQIGRTIVGSGVGPSLAYAPGKLYLAGPYNGSAISLVSITSGLVGPFDIGTVVVREGFKIDRETAEVFIDATGSDPIPHIIKGVPVHLRDIRAYTDRPEFVLNPTGCQRTSTASTLLGSGLDFGSEADDRPVTVSTPFQAADCAALEFKPKLSFSLKGSTRRGGHPAFSATLKMKGHGESNIKRAQVTLPRSEFLENAHIKTICTRVQFRAEQCPAGSIYGFASARTPILDEPLSGPVFLRSSEHQLPDLVATLHNGKITIDLVGRIDSLNGRIRNTFEAAPDAPVETFNLTMQGGKKGLLVNSTNICRGTHRAIADFTAHNGKQLSLHPPLKAKCGKGVGNGNTKRGN